MKTKDLEVSGLAVRVDDYGATATAVRRAYYQSADRLARTAVLHMVKEDKPATQIEGLVKRLLDEAGVKDGDEFQLHVGRTGRRPFGGRRWKRVGRRSLYRAETNEERLRRIKINGYQE